MPFDLPPPPKLWMPPKPAIIRAAPDVPGSTLDRLFDRELLQRQQQERLQRGMLVGSFAASAVRGLRKAGGSTALPTLTFLGSQTSTAGAASYTFSTFNAGGNGLGAETSAKHIVVVTGSRSNTGTAISSIAVDGSGTTILDQGINGAVCLSGIAIISTSATSGDVVVNIAGGGAHCFAAVYKILNLTSATAVATAKSALQTANLNLNTSAAGIVIAGGFSNAATSATPTGITEDLDTTIGGLRTAYAGSASGVVAATPRTVTIAWAAAGDSHCTAVSLR